MQLQLVLLFTFYSASVIIYGNDGILTRLKLAWRLHQLSISALMMTLPRRKAAKPFSSREMDSDNTKNNRVKDPISGIAQFVPTEIIGIYVFGLSIVPIVRKEFSWFGNLQIYVFCILATPIFAAISHLIYNKSLGKVSSNSRLLWRVFCGTLAFGIWGLAIPDNPLVNSESFKALVAFIALCLSMLLKNIDTLFDK